MSAFQTCINDILKKDCEFFCEEITNLNVFCQEGLNYCTKVLNELKKYDKTGNFSDVDRPSLNYNPVNSSLNSRRSSTKENAEPNQSSVIKQVNTQPKRNAFKENNQVLAQEPSDISPGVKVKLERVSDNMVTVKTEKEEMPAPTQLPPRRKKIKAEPAATKSMSTRNRSKRTECDNEDSSDEVRPKRTRKKPIRYKSRERKDSDVILQNTTVTTVVLSDNEDAGSTTSEKLPESNITKNNTESEQENKNTRSTRTKNRTKVDNYSTSSEESQVKPAVGRNKTVASKRGRIESSDEESNLQKHKDREVKRSKSDSDHNDDNTASSKTKKQPTTAESHIPSKRKNKDKSEDNHVDKNLFSEDESDGEYKTPPQKSSSRNIENVEISKSKSEDKDKLQEKPTMFDTTIVVEKPKYPKTTLKTIESEKESLSNPILNATMVIEKASVDQKDVESNTMENGLITDDESEEETRCSPMKLHIKKNQAKGVKPIFSPFDGSPVKKKVEAFERLGAEASAIPTRVTRTKTRAQTKEQKENENTTENEKKEDHPGGPRSVVKEKAKFFTPTISKFLPKSSSTNKVTQKLPVPSMNVSIYNESILSAKSASALKSSQAEYRERERQRREKEAEALRKRELIIQAQIEEKKRKREGKQLKAQQHREMLEKETQKKLEAQRIKDEKYKKVIAEKEEKLQKQREELEHKRLLAKKRAIEEKKKEEQQKAEQQRKIDEALKIKEKTQKLQQDEEHPQPIYLLKKAPLLPTDDCYDSDDPEFKTHRPKEPDWARVEDLRTMQMCMIAARETLKNTFFCCQATTPDLQELFEHIDPRKLKRTSSAIWRKPPRYTMMPTMDQDLLEDSSEDDY